MIFFWKKITTPDDDLQKLLMGEIKFEVE